MSSLDGLLGKVHCRDNVMISEDFPAESVGLIIVDPPGGVACPDANRILRKKGFLLQGANSKVQGFKVIGKVFNYDMGGILEDKPGDVFFVFVREDSSIEAAVQDSTIRFKRREDRKVGVERSVLTGMYFVANFSNPGDVVLDSYAGTGSFGVASLLLGRKYVGYEINQDRCKEANERLRKALRVSAETCSVILGGEVK